MARIFRGKRIILGVTGGIAAYKVVELARNLTVEGATVDVMLTRAARDFVTPLTFQTLTRRPVRTEVIEQWSDAEQGHVSLGLNADVVVVAPATAHAIAKIANGLADDMLSVSILASPAPIVIAPAMDHHMYLNPATQENLSKLDRRGVTLVGPEQGPLASGLIGHGRLSPIPKIAGEIRRLLGAEGPLAGRKVVVSAGPTQEALDPIRYLTNRSTGKMGYAIAQAAIDAGASTTLVTGSTSLIPPVGCRLVKAASAHEMSEAVQEHTRDADILIMAAAVADYRPATVATEKIKKGDGGLTLQLERTVDILARIDRPGLFKVGFAAETTNLLDYARGKLTAKRLDLIVANDANEAMGSDRSSAYLIDRDGEATGTGAQSKEDLAEMIIDHIVERLGQ